MFKKDTRRGLALGAAFSLIASLFVTAPAAQADEDSLVIAPFVGTSNTMLITEDFVVKTRLGQNQLADRINNLKYLIEKPAGYNLTVSNTVSANIASSSFDVNTTNSVTVLAGSTSQYVTPASPSTTQLNQLRIQLWSASAPTSVSKAVTVKVTAFLDIDPNGTLDKTTEPYETYEIVFVPWSSMNAAITLEQPVFGADEVNATAAISGVNVDQLSASFHIAFTTSYNVGAVAGHTVSPELNKFVATGLMSASADVSASAGINSSVSAILFYDVNGDGVLDVDTEQLAVSKLGVKIATITGVTISSVAGANAAASGSDAAKARIASTVTIKSWAVTGSTVVAAKVPTITATTSVALSATKYLVINGTTYTQSSQLNTAKWALTAGTDGKGDLTVQFVGFADSNTVSFTAKAENVSNTYMVHVEETKWTVASADEFLNTTPGAAVSLVVDVKDQFKVASPLVDQTVQVSVVGTGFTAQTISQPVVGGKATFTITPAPATKTGSFTVTPNLWYTDRNGTLVEEAAGNIAAETASTVFVLANLDNKLVTKPTASYSSSISYGAAMSYSADITANFQLTGSAVVASAPGVIFLYDKKTYSDTVTMTAGSAGLVTFKATSRLSGTYTISMVAGNATASTQLVVEAPLHTAGKTITYDKSSLEAGATSTITGTLVDANGNPVATGGTASIAVTWTGKGLPFGNSAAMQTNKDGEFSFQVLVLSTEIGEAAVSATYMPAGSATDTKNLTFVQAIDIVAPGTTAAPATDQKLTVGSFKGFVAIYTLNYTGQKLSAKVAGKWTVVESLNRFQRVVRNTGAGFTIIVDLYIDSEFVRSETIVTK